MSFFRVLGLVCYERNLLFGYFKRRNKIRRIQGFSESFGSSSSIYFIPSKKQKDTLTFWRMAVVKCLFRDFRPSLELVPSLVPVNRCNISLNKMGDTRSPRVSLLIRHTICTTVVHTWLFNAIIHHALRNNLQLNRYDRFSSSRQLDRDQWRLLSNEKKSS